MRSPTGRSVGNPAAVVLARSAAADPGWMQARRRRDELGRDGLPRPQANRSRYDLRWFTPEVEVDLCGHATCAGPRSVGRAGRLDEGRHQPFHSRSGLLTPPEPATIVLDFPSTPTGGGRHRSAATSAHLAGALAAA